MNLFLNLAIWCKKNEFLDYFINCNILKRASEISKTSEIQENPEKREKRIVMKKG
jgi:hypothetical protein